MSAPQTKRTRQDATAKNPTSEKETPMGVAKESVRKAVESLLPSAATILARLGKEFVVSLHKHYTKDKQAKKFDEDVDYIPISARVKIALTGSKLVEQDQEFLSLVGSTNDLVTQFKKDL